MSVVTRLSALALAACALLLPASAQAAPENWMQDDDLLVYAQPATVEATLDEMVTLGVDRLRVSLFWRLVAPQPTSQVKPAGFEGKDPAAYAPGAWERYDRLVAEAKERGIGINFDVTGPGPSWATGTPAREDIEPTFEPDPAEFGAFVTAAGTRYSGAYVPTPAQADAPPSRPGGSGLPLLPRRAPHRPACGRRRSCGRTG